MKNVFIIHSYNGNTEHSFAPSIEKLCKNNNIDYYFPRFPTGSNANYESWEEVLNEYRKKGILNDKSIVIAHSLGAHFIPKYLVKNNVIINTYISVAGFVDYNYNGNLKKIVDIFQPTSNEFEKCKNLVKNRYSIYSDNDIISDTDKLEKYANMLSAHKIVINGAGHFGPKSGITEIEDINNIIIGHRKIHS